jgi:hypothetical protein
VKTAIAVPHMDVSGNSWGSAFQCVGFSPTPGIITLGDAPDRAFFLCLSDKVEPETLYVAKIELVIQMHYYSTRVYLGIIRG